MPPAGQRPRRAGTVVLAGVLVGGAGLLASAVGLAQPGGESGRLSVALSLGQRDDDVRAGRSQVAAAGSAVSGLSLGGAWFSGGHLGFGARLGLERFALRGIDGSASAGQERVVNGLETSAGMLLRSGRLGPLRLEGELGYALVRLPLGLLAEGVITGPRLESTTLDAHGPLARATATVEARPWLALELSGVAVPVSFGGQYRGAALSPRRFGGGAAVSVGDVKVAGTRLVAVLAAELERTAASGSDASVTLIRRQLGLGLRASWPVPSAAATTATAAPSVAAPVPQPQPAPPPEPAPQAPPAAPTVIAGLVRAETGDLLDARVQIVELGIDVPVDERGTFRLEIPPGEYTLVITAPGFIEQRKRIQGASGEQRIFNVDLQMEAP